MKIISRLFSFIRLAFGSRIGDWILLKMYGVPGSFEIRRQSKTIRQQANHVRELTREFKGAFAGSALENVSYFPEISDTLEDCSMCETACVLRVQPDMLCYACWLKSVEAIQEAIKDVRNGKSPEEAMLLLGEHREQLAPTS